MEHSILLEAAADKDDTSKSLFQGSTDKTLVTKLQKQLFEPGFDNYQANGNYGTETVNIVVAFAAKNNYKSDGTKVPNQLTKLILQRHVLLSSMYPLDHL